MSKAKKLIHGLTHKELVSIAGRWLRNTEKCSVVLSELVSQAEVPDAVGWKNRQSRLVECKATRSDFLADQKKHARLIIPKHYAFGMGTFRYYMVPEGLVVPSEVPKGWGLLQVTFTGRVKRTIRSARWWLPEIEIYHEMGLLLSALRRYQESERMQ